MSKQSMQTTRQVCLWHLDMVSSKMTCFCKLTVPAMALGLPMDVLNSLGVLRSEQGIAGSKTASGHNTEDKTTPGSGTADVALEPTSLGFPFVQAVPLSC